MTQLDLTDDLINTSKRVHRSLKTGQQIEYGPWKQELDDIVTVCPFTLEGTEKVGYNGPDRNQQWNAEKYRNRLQPGRNRAEDYMVCTGPDIQKRYRPETDHRQLVTVKRIAGWLGDKIVGQCHSKRRED